METQTLTIMLRDAESIVQNSIVGNTIIIKKLIYEKMSNNFIFDTKSDFSIIKMSSKYKCSL